MFNNEISIIEGFIQSIGLTCSDGFVKEMFFSEIEGEILSVGGGFLSADLGS
jgi:hypothetical protein